MPGKLLDITAMSGSAMAVTAGVACDPVPLSYITLNELSVVFGVVSGFFAMIFYAIKAYKAVKTISKDGYD